MTKTGPSDVSDIVWALGECFYFFFRSFLILTNVFMLYLCSQIDILEENERAVTVKIGPNNTKSPDMLFGL